MGLLWWLSGKESAYNAGDPGSILGSGRSPGEGNSNPFQYSCLEIPMHKGAWWAYSPWGCRELDVTERLVLFQYFQPYCPAVTSVHGSWRNHSFDSVGKVMSPLFNMLSRFVIAFLPRNKHLLISWLQLPSSVILEPRKRKSVTVFTFSPSACHIFNLHCLLE